MESKTMNLEYKVSKETKENRTASIEDENFICVLHIENGCQMITAFISKGDNNLVIKLSKNGSSLNIERMAGSTALNARLLLEKNYNNTIYPNGNFIMRYNLIKQNLIIEL